MFISRFQSGEWIPLVLQTRDSSRNIVWPTHTDASNVSPFVTIYDQDGLVVMGPKALAAKDPGNHTGLFEMEQRVGPEYAVGTYMVLFEWRDNFANENKAIIDTFQVVAGGHKAGSYISLHYYEKPHASFLVGDTDGGSLEYRRNPRL